jgi:hypothetical protein
MEKVVEALTSSLGSHFRLLSSSKAEHRPHNSHGIIATSGMSSVTWTWPGLSAEDIKCTPKGVWCAAPSASIASAQFCKIANGSRGGSVDATGQFQVTFLLAPSVLSNKTSINTSTLSPFAPAFNYAAIDGEYKTDKPCQSSLSPLANPFMPGNGKAENAGCSRSLHAIVSNSKHSPAPTTSQDRVPKIEVTWSDVVRAQCSGEEIINKSSAPATTAPVTSTSPETLNQRILQDVEELKRLGSWEAFVKSKRCFSDFANLDNVRGHPAHRLLQFYRQRGAPVKMKSKPWSREQISAALSRGAHQSCFAYMDFLREEFTDMMEKGQWVILPASAVESLPGLQVSPPGVVPQRERRPRWICDYTFSGVNGDTLPLAALDAMQFGHALDRILREIILADPSLGPVQLMKVDLSDGFYRVNLNIDDIPKLGVAFPTEPGQEPLIALPLVLPMGWKNSPPIFSTATETIADLANQRIQAGVTPAPHPMDEKAEAVVPTNPMHPEQPAHQITNVNSYLPLQHDDEEDSPQSVVTMSNKCKDREEWYSKPRPSRDASQKSRSRQGKASNINTTSVDRHGTFTPDSDKQHCPSSTFTVPVADARAAFSDVEQTPQLSVKVSSDPSHQVVSSCASKSCGSIPSGTQNHNIISSVAVTSLAQQVKLPCWDHQSALQVPTVRDPSLPSTNKPVSYVDIFVDDFVGLAQGSSNSRRVRRILMHAIDDVFRPLESSDNAYRRAPVSVKKLVKGDCSWSTIKLVLGWIIDTVSMTIHLPPHRVERLAEILASIPITQKRTSVKKWHKVLGELRSMALALPGARNLFSQMQHALTNKVKGRVNLNKGVHQALEDFRWLLSDIASRPTSIAELVPLLPSAEGHHDASGLGAGGVWFPAEHLVPREGFDNKPVVWRLQWPQYIIDKLVTSKNPNGTISNSDFELAGGLLHLEALSQCFDIRERTVLSKTDNLNTLFWQRKGSATTEKVPAHLLRLFGIHQRFHRYVPRHDYLSGPSNPIADALSRDFELSWDALLESLSPLLPQYPALQVWTPSAQVVDAVIAALLKKRQSPESILQTPPQAGTRAQSTTLSSQELLWPSSPLSKPSSTKYNSYKKSHDEFISQHLQPQAIPSGLTRLKVSYGSIPRRKLVWGPR